MRARRENTDQIIATLLAGSNPFEEWIYVEDIETRTDITPNSFVNTIKFLRDEYGAIEQLSITRAIRLNKDGLARYDAVQRLHSEKWAWPNER
jgi:hypothetical protein